MKKILVGSTSAALYHDPEGRSLVEYGHSKDHRPDLAQFKAMMSSLAALGMPLATLVVPGNQADDRLYLPVIEQSTKSYNHVAYSTLVTAKWKHCRFALRLRPAMISI